MKIDPSRVDHAVQEVNTPSEHIGLALDPDGVLYGYEHVDVDSDAVEPGIPSFPNPGTVDADYFKVTTVVAYEEVPDHRDLHILPKGWLGWYLDLQSQLSGTVLTEITPIDEQAALKELQQYRNHDAPSLSDLVSQVDKNKPGDVPHS